MGKTKIFFRAGQVNCVHDLCLLKETKCKIVLHRGMGNMALNYQVMSVYRFVFVKFPILVKANDRTVSRPLEFSKDGKLVKQV